MSSDFKYAFATATGGGGGGGAVDPDMVRAVTLTGLDKTVGVVTAADSILSGMGKLAANTEALQGSIGGKQDTVTGAATTVVALDLAVNRAVLSNNSGKLAVSSVTSTELGYLANATSEIQAQLNAKQASINQGLNTGDSPTFVGVTLSGLTANQLVSTDALTKNLISLPTATYPSLTEISYVKGVTSAIQTQFGGKQNSLTGAATSIATADLTVDRVLTSNALGKVDVSATTAIELSYLSGVTSAIQSQINGKQATVTGAATTIVTADLTASRLLQSNALGKVEVLDTATYPSLTEISYVKGVTSAIQTQLNTLSGNGFTKYATIAAAEAATATEGAIAYVVDKIGFYEYCTNCSQTVDHDLILSTGAAGTTRWVKVQTVKRGVGDVGWVDTDGATISTTSATNVRLTIATTAIYAIKGLRVELPAGDYDCTLSGVAGVKFIYFDDTSKVLKFQDTVFDFAHHCPVSVAYWSGTAIVAAPQTEFHGIRDIAWHKWAHNNLGTQYKEGLLFTGSVQPDNTTAPADATVSYLWSTTGKIVDEDIEANCGVGQWLQTLGSGLTAATAAIFNYFYYNGTFVTTLPAMADRTPFIHGGGVTFPYWNNGGTLQEASDNRYIVYHYFATPMTGGWSVFARPHNAEYTTLALAAAARPSQLTWSNYAELKHIYTAIFRTRAQFTNVPHRCKLVSLQDFRLAAGSPVAGISATDHQALSNRTALNSHPIGAIAGITGGSIPFVDATTSALNEDSGLSWDNTGKILSVITLSTDTISEKTSAAGVTIDTVLLKDGSAQNTGFYGAEPGAVSTSTSGQAGTAVTASRSDHNHDLGTHAHVDATNGGQVSHASLSNLHQDVATTASPSFVSVTTTTSVITDTISERTLNAGVTIDGVLIKDGLVDGQDISARIDQDVKTTSTPTFAGIITSGNVDGVDVSAFKTDYDARVTQDAKVNQDVRTTALPTFTRGSELTQTFNPAAAQDIQSAQKRTGLNFKSGASDYAVVTNTQSVRTGDFSAIVTIKSRSSIVSGQFEVALNVRDGSSHTPTFLLGVHSSGVYFARTGSSTEIVLSGVAKTTGVQTLIAVRKSGILSLYVGGKLLGTPIASVTDLTASSIVVGNYWDQTAGFDGLICRSGLLNYALPEDKIRRYSAGERLDWEDIGGSMNTVVTTTDVSALSPRSLCTESQVADGGLGRNVYQVVATSALSDCYCYLAGATAVGKRYRMKFKAKGLAGGMGKSFTQANSNQSTFLGVTNPALTALWQDYTLEVTALSGEAILPSIQSVATGDGFQLDSFTYDTLGALAAYEGENLLPSAGIWPDSSGNNNDLTITGATVINSQDSLEIKDRLIVGGNTTETVIIGKASNTVNHLVKLIGGAEYATTLQFVQNTTTRGYFGAQGSGGNVLAVGAGVADYDMVMRAERGFWVSQGTGAAFGIAAGSTDFKVLSTTASTSSADGALVVAGGVGVGKELNVAGYTQLGGSTAPKMAMLTTVGTAITIPAGAAPQSATYTVTGIAGARIKNVIGRVLPQGSTSYRSIPCSSDMGIASYTIDWSVTASSIITVTRSSAYETGLSAAIQLYIMYEAS